MLITKVRDVQQVGPGSVFSLFSVLVSCLEARWRVRAIAHLKNLRSEALLIIFYWMKGVISEIKRSMI